MKLGPLHITGYGATGRTLKEKLVLRDADGMARVSVHLCERKKGPPTVEQRLAGRYVAELVASAERMAEALAALADGESPLDGDVKTTIQGILAPVLQARVQWEGFNDKGKTEGEE